MRALHSLRSVTEPMRACVCIVCVRLLHDLERACTHTNTHAQRRLGEERHAFESSGAMVRVRWQATAAASAASATLAAAAASAAACCRIDLSHFYSGCVALLSLSSSSSSSTTIAKVTRLVFAPPNAALSHAHICVCVCQMGNTCTPGKWPNGRARQHGPRELLPESMCAYVICGLQGRQAGRQACMRDRFGCLVRRESAWRCCERACACVCVRSRFARLSGVKLDVNCLISMEARAREPRMAATLNLLRPTCARVSVLVYYRASLW